MLNFEKPGTYTKTKGKYSPEEIEVIQDIKSFWKFLRGMVVICLLSALALASGLTRDLSTRQIHPDSLVGRLMKASDH